MLSFSSLEIFPTNFIDKISFLNSDELLQILINHYNVLTGYNKYILLQKQLPTPT